MGRVWIVTTRGSKGIVLGTTRVSTPNPSHASEVWPVHLWRRCLRPDTPHM